jgi:hypothetical protein
VLLACLGFGFFVRLVPELLAGSLPVGWDTVHYAVAMTDGVVLAHWSGFFASSWLLYALIVPVYGVLQGDPFLLLKVVAPLLFGLNVAGVFWFARRMLLWSVPLSVFACVLFGLQFASLRISWDLLRNALGLGLLLFAFASLKGVGSWRGFALFSALSLLSVFAHEYAAVTLVAVLSGLGVYAYLRKDVGFDVKRALLAATPGLAVFAVGLWLRFFPVYAAPATNVITVGDSVSGNVGGLFFVVDYLRVQTPVDGYAGYLALASSVLVLFLVLFGPYLFLVWKGFFRSRVLDAWTGLLLVGAFGCLVVPFFALQYWHRWMFMLVYPFTFYAAFGVARLLGKARERRVGFFRLRSGRAAGAMLALTFVLGVSYLAMPVLVPATGNGAVPYVESVCGYFSISPTVPYQDAASVVASMAWLDANMEASSCVVLQHTFLNWGRLYLDGSCPIVYYLQDSASAVSAASGNGFSRVYAVGWNRPVGWGEVPVPEGFESVADFGRISVYVNEV